MESYIAAIIQGSMALTYSK